MKNFININNVKDYQGLIKESIEIKNNPYSFKKIGINKTLGLIFFNSSLRTRLSTLKAAKMLGLETIVMNFNNEGWEIEFEEKTIMSKNSAEHVKEAAQVISQYCDIIGIRAFAELKNKNHDESEKIINSFVKYGSVPIINLESSCAHPLQALADAITIEEHKNKSNPKIVISWAPHPKSLPHAVANSFINMARMSNYDLVITNPVGYDLNPKITKGINVTHNQEEAFKNADFIYAKNWSSYNDYGKVLINNDKWMINKRKMEITNNAKFMHCLPVRRNVVVEDAVLDSNYSLAINQANNRTYAAQTILKKIILNER
ncbi:MAG: N-acetylornithine carbamoyltransferase [Flavobacteriaceae bacterium]|nr:N-acetylornithine carbamoyltransferase [Flavobacteriaceae bacterium]MDG2367957.1 N-acetylornithine carbamoyltransferase [Flavobacteriaceae bacterium]|tara:strand:+ start:1927 stop:2877 length:951 start_codon:yes stop_codon:yes gene_type:complete